MDQADMKTSAPVSTLRSLLINKRLFFHLSTTLYPTDRLTSSASSASSRFLSLARVGLYFEASTKILGSRTIQVLGFVTLQITLGDVPRSVDALTIPSLGPDRILLDNATMARFGAVLDWKRQRLFFLSSKTSIPAVHRLSSMLRNLCTRT